MSDYQPKTLHRAVPAADGSLIRGEISNEMAAACGVRAGHIVLFQGMDYDGTGFGKTHLDVKEARKSYLRELGFSGINDFVSQICANFTELRLGKKGRLALCMEVSHRAIVAYIEYKKPPGCWHLVTALPVRRFTDQPLWRR
ncbi:hypothetical protein KUV28_21330 [Ferrimonas balearica]|nr:hypothetical protein [Ferrimonas balearica]